MSRSGYPPYWDDHQKTCRGSLTAGPSNPSRSKAPFRRPGPCPASVQRVRRDCSINCCSSFRISWQVPCCAEGLAMTWASSRRIRQKIWSGLVWVILLDCSAEEIRETPAQSDRASPQQMVKTVYLIPRKTRSKNRPKSESPQHVSNSLPILLWCTLF